MRRLLLGEMEMNATQKLHWAERVRLAVDSCWRTDNALTTLANRAGIPEMRLRLWVINSIRITHVEVEAIHEALSENITLEKSDNDIPNDEGTNCTTDPMQYGGGECQQCEDNDIPLHEGTPTPPTS
jgi:hypothetical protein